MQFNSIVFVIFFVVFFAMYYSVKRLRVQNVLLLVASCTFYGYWDWRFLSLISISVLSTYATALLALRSRPKLWTWINVSVNLSILCAFKYFNFFAENLVGLVRAFGLALDYPTVRVLLPVGISFYTFQAISYSIDAYRRDIKPERSIISFALYICYFPQLVAGPIERASVLLPQINAERRTTYPDLVLGMRQALWGLVKKVIVADGCVTYVDKLFAAEYTTAGAMGATLAALLFSVQIYCDFSGYCDIARGVSQMLGIKIMQNFSYSYFSTTVQEFWRKWNISLMNWFRDYVYIPLGGSRRGNAKTYRNLLVVFVISGLWHGASWNFVIWGAYWGFVMVAYRYWHKRRHRANTCAATNDVQCALYGNTGQIVSMCITLALVVIGWVIFRSESLEQTVSMVIITALPVICLMTAMGLVIYILAHLNPAHKRFVAWATSLTVIAFACIKPDFIVHHLILAYVIGVFVVEWIGSGQTFALQRMPQNRAIRYGLYYLMIFLILVNVHGSAQFIYFKF